MLEALAFERERETALLAQIDAVVLEEEGARIDDVVKALLSPAELELLDDILGEPLEYDALPDDGFISFDQPDDPLEDEVERLGREVDHSRARQQALEHLAALLTSPLSELTAPETAL